MRLQYVPDGSNDGPLLRLFEWQSGEVAALRSVAEQLALGHLVHVPLHEQAFIASTDGVTFDWVADSWGRGVLVPSDGLSFVMQLTSAEWSDVVEIIRPFERSPIGFSWLLPVTEVQVLLSYDGCW
jgi:hypothetical protein